MRGDPEWCFKQDEWVLPKRETRVSTAEADFIDPIDAPDLFKSVMSREDKVWLYGVVRYSDIVSEEEHEVRFCFEINIRGDGSTYLFPGGPETYRGEK
jgi:hypothetical protein